MQFLGSHQLPLLFLICGKIPPTHNWGCQLLLMMEEFTTDERPTEKNQKMDTMHTYVSTNTNLFEGAVEFLKSQNLAYNLQR